MKSILVIDEEELQFLKDITNHFTNYNTSKIGVSIVNKIRNAQDTTELLVAIQTIRFIEFPLKKYNTWRKALNKIDKALGGQDDKRKKNN